MSLYFWSGSNRAGEITALAKHGRGIGVSVEDLDRGGRAMRALVALADVPRRIVANVTRAKGGRPIVMLCRRRDELPEGDVEVLVEGEPVVLGFRKIAVNVARATEGGRNILGPILRRLFGDTAGERGRGHKVEILRTASGWRMSVAELDEARRSPSPVFVDSGAFSEVRFDAELGRMVTVKPITDAQWRQRLAAYGRIVDALGERAFVVAPDKVGDQVETLARLRRYAPEVRSLRARGANVIVPIQVGELDGAAFDREVTRILGFGDYVRGIPAKKAAATVEQVAALSRALPADARVHLLGLGPWAKHGRYEKILAAIDRAPELVSCDSARIKSLVGRKNGPGYGPRPLTVLTDAVKAARGWLGRKLGSAEAEEVKHAALDAYLVGGAA